MFNATSSEYQDYVVFVEDGASRTEPRGGERDRLREAQPEGRSHREAGRQHLRQVRQLGEHYAGRDLLGLENARSSSVSAVQNALYQRSSKFDPLTVVEN